MSPVQFWHWKIWAWDKVSQKWTKEKASGIRKPSLLRPEGKKTLKCLVSSVLGEIKIWQGRQRVFRLGAWQYKEYLPHGTSFDRASQREKIDSASERRGAVRLRGFTGEAASEQDLKDEWYLYLMEKNIPGEKAAWKTQTWKPTACEGKGRELGSQPLLTWPPQLSPGPTQCSTSINFEFCSVLLGWFLILTFHTKYVCMCRQYQC